MALNGATAPPIAPFPDLWGTLRVGLRVLLCQITPAYLGHSAARSGRQGWAGLHLYRACQPCLDLASRATNWSTTGAGGRWANIPPFYSNKRGHSVVLNVAKPQLTTGNFYTLETLAIKC